MSKATVIPEYTVLPKYFVSHRTYAYSDQGEGYKWVLVAEKSDPTLTEQVRGFIERTGAALVNGGLASPTVTLYESAGVRTYLLASSIMYIPVVEASDDGPRAVDGPGSAVCGRALPGQPDEGDLV